MSLFVGLTAKTVSVGLFSRQIRRATPAAMQYIAFMPSHIGVILFTRPQPGDIFFE